MVIMTMLWSCTSRLQGVAASRGGRLPSLLLQSLLSSSSSSSSDSSPSVPGSPSNHSETEVEIDVRAFSSKATTTFSPEFNGLKTDKGLTIREEVVFRGYRNIVRREVRLPNDHKVIYDVLTQKHLSVVVFPWDSRSKTTTLVREYHPGPEKFLYGTVAGMYELNKHTSPLECGKHELEEEAQLQSNQWYELVDTAKTSMGMPFDKYSNNHFFPYLALDCESVINPKPMDDDEFITLQRNVTYSQLMDYMKTGQINVVSTFTILLGFQKLDELGIPYR